MADSDLRSQMTAPRDWCMTSLGEIASIYTGSTPSRAVPAFWEGDIPWVTPGELTGLKTKYLNGTRESITKAGLTSCAATLVPKDTLLVTTRATLGSSALSAMPVTTNQGFRSLVFGGQADPHFFYHLSSRLTTELKRRASGTTFLEISGREFAAVRVPLPPLPEQHRIAEILDTLDEAIRRTEQVIAKLQQMKQGLLHDLLTRGIDENGELRGPDQPPASWKLTTLGEHVYLKGGFGFPDRYQGHSEGELPFYKVSDMSTAGNARYLGRANNYVSRATAAQQGWHPAQRGGVAFAKVGAALLLNRRRILTVDSLVDNNMMVAVPRDSVDQSWLYWWLQAVDFAVFVQPGALPSVNQGQLGALSIALPTLDEQIQVGTILDDYEARIEAEIMTRQKFNAMKLGLMNDLLTGRVRVTATEETAS